MKNSSSLEPDGLPPHATEAERGLLGCLLLSPDTAVPDLLDRSPMPLELFYDLRHRRLAEVLLEMAEAGRLVDTVTLGQRLRDLKAEADVGGADYWTGHPDFAPSHGNLPHYVGILEESRTRRRLIAAGVRIVEAGQDSLDVTEAQAIAEREVLSIVDGSEDGNGSSTRDAVRTAVDRFAEAHEHRGRSRGLATGLCDLDRLLRGLRPGQLIVIGARPSEGKSALAAQIAERVAVDCSLAVGFWSLEMTREEIISRMVCSRARVPLDRADDGQLSEQEIARLASPSAAIAKAPLHIYDRAGLSITTLCAMARRAHRKHKLALVVVDYCQLLHGEIRRRDTRNLEIGEITGGLKALAKELGAPVLLLSQLNRDTDRERDREPRLSDLRDSGSIEQDADIVVLIHPEQPKDGNVPDQQRAKLLVRKNRNGRQGRVSVSFNRPLVRFESP